jgi:transcriptional regulator with XRE-family HTH domain
MSLIIAKFIKEKRKQLKLTQPVRAERAVVWLRFISELVQGKQTVQLYLCGICPSMLKSAIKCTLFYI